MHAEENRKVSVITTIKNEEKSIGKFIESLLNQSLAPDEIIITDGGSTDNTVEVVSSYIKKGAPIKLFIAPGNRSVGRNRAIEEAGCEIIASTDAGCRLDGDWLKNITEPFFSDQAVDVVSGYTASDAQTFIERCIAAVNLPDVHEIDPDHFLPSSRSAAFKKSAWERAGGYPEWLLFAEDTLFNFRLVRAGCKFVFKPEAAVYWRPVSSKKKFFKQMMDYSRGDGQAQLYVFKYYFLQKYMLYLAGLALLLLSFRLPAAGVVLALLMGLYFSRPVLKAYRKLRSWKVIFIMPVLTVARDVAEMIGFLRGTVDRLRDPDTFVRE